MEVIKLIVGAIETNCYILKSDNELAIIDPGDEAEIILDKIKNIGGEVKYIINTHYHYDHTGANQEIKEVIGAPILIHENEKPFIDFTPDRYLQNNDEIKIGEEKLLILNFPGHTKGSICLLGNDFVFTGDLLFKDGYGRTDLAGGSPVEMAESLERIKNFLRPGMTLYPGHGDDFKIEN